MKKIKNTLNGKNGSDDAIYEESDVPVHTYLQAIRNIKKAQMKFSYRWYVF